MKRSLHVNNKHIICFTRLTRTTGFYKTKFRVWSQSMVKKHTSTTHSDEIPNHRLQKKSEWNVSSLTSRSSIQEVTGAVTPETSRVQSQVTFTGEDQPQSAKFSNTPPTTLQLRPYSLRADL